MAEKEKRLEMQNKLEGFIDFFKEIPDHRIARNKRYCVEELLLIAFCGMVAGYLE
ncbi:transposase family protein [Candidatus Rickettsiella viridis]|uniref:transposase family protein n=1 Tax=Candidatus Rickettsiella viridis TaxID=676208 RepID=UPI000F847250